LYNITKGKQGRGEIVHVDLTVFEGITLKRDTEFCTAHHLPLCISDLFS
jgi:hypothetical protein